MGRKERAKWRATAMQIINSGTVSVALLKCNLKFRENMLPFSVFHGTRPPILVERWTLVLYQQQPNVALQSIFNVHCDIGPTLVQPISVLWLGNHQADRLQSQLLKPLMQKPYNSR